MAGDKSKKDRRVWSGVSYASPTKGMTRAGGPLLIRGRMERQRALAPLRAWHRILLLPQRPFERRAYKEEYRRGRLQDRADAGRRRVPGRDQVQTRLEASRLRLSGGFPALDPMMGLADDPGQPIA